MSINQFTKDAAYFQSRRDSGMLLNAEDLDFQFNNLIDYLNTKIVPMINSFIQQEFIGVNDANLSNACLLNIGDGNVKWTSINSNIFPDYSIPLSKFAPVAPNCIVWAGNNGIFGYNTASNLNDGILFSRFNATSVWRKVNTGDIADKTLIGSNIALGAVKIEHLGAELREVLFAAPRQILNEAIITASIKEENLQDLALPEEKIDQVLLKSRQDNINAKNYYFVNDSIENRHIANQVLIGGAGLSSIPSRDGVKYMSLQMRPIWYQDSNDYTFTSGNIIDESITPAMIEFNQTYGAAKQKVSFRHFAQGAIESRHIKDESVYLYGFFQQANGDRIPKEALDPVIRSIIGV
jgi:hypothetical protein